MHQLSILCYLCLVTMYSLGKFYIHVLPINSIYLIFMMLNLKVKKGRRKSIKRSLHEYGRENVKHIFTEDYNSFYWVRQYLTH